MAHCASAFCGRGLDRASARCLVIIFRRRPAHVNRRAQASASRGGPGRGGGPAPSSPGVSGTWVLTMSKSPRRRRSGTACERVRTSWPGLGGQGPAASVASTGSDSNWMAARPRGKRKSSAGFLKQYATSCRRIGSAPRGDGARRPGPDVPQGRRRPQGQRHGERFPCPHCGFAGRVDTVGAANVECRYTDPEPRE